MIHKLANCQSLKIHSSSNVWQYVVVLPNAKIGANCNICAHCFIENDVIIGDCVTVKCGVYLWDGIILEDNVQIGPNVTFTNDRYPRAKREFVLQRTLIKKGASIGAGAIILGGVTIGENAMIGAGSLVTKDVPAGELWFGSPAKFVKKIEY
jgi:UDP-2-acetamido-3-amino-2,3-dideoxy-glucuronate N-acetyltransferase